MTHDIISPMILGTLGGGICPPAFCLVKELHWETNFIDIPTRMFSDLRNSSVINNYYIEICHVVIVHITFTFWFPCCLRNNLTSVRLLSHIVVLVTRGTMSLLSPDLLPMATSNALLNCSTSSQYQDLPILSTKVSKSQVEATSLISINCLQNKILLNIGQAFY